MEKKIYLLRHCSTKDSELKINGGITDTPLSELGTTQANELVEKLSAYTFGLIFISPLQRTSQTLEPYLKSLQIKPTIILEPLIIERDLGLLTNSISGDGQVPASIKASGKSQTEWTPPEGESTVDVYNRALKFLTKLKEASENNILVCSHQNFLRCLELAILNQQPNDENFFSATPPRLGFGELREFTISSS